MAKPRKPAQRDVAKDWWHWFEGLSKPAGDRLHVTHEQFRVAMCFVYAAQKGVELRFSHQEIGRMTGTSRVQAKRIVRGMRQCSMMKAAGGAGIEKRYELLATADWRLGPSSAKKLRPRTRTLRAKRTADGATELHIPGQGVARVWGDPEIGIRAGERIVATIRGGDVSSLHISEKATVEVSSGIRLQPEPGSSTTPVTPKAQSAAQACLKSTGVANDPTLPLQPCLKSTGVTNDPTFEPAARAGFQHIRFDNFQGGSVLALAPKRGFTREVNKALAQMEARRTHVEAVVDFLRRRGLQAMACVELEQKDQPGRRALLQIEAPPTGLWRQVRECIAKKMDPHRFGTRMAAFGLEFGVCRGTELVEHKGGGHAEIFRAVEAALKAMGKPGAIRFVTIDSVDLDSVEAAQTSQRRSA